MSSLLMMDGTTLWADALRLPWHPRMILFLSIGEVSSTTLQVMILFLLKTPKIF